MADQLPPPNANKKPAEEQTPAAATPSLPGAPGAASTIASQSKPTSDVPAQTAPGTGNYMVGNGGFSKSQVAGLPASQPGIVINNGTLDKLNAREGLPSAATPEQAATMAATSLPGYQMPGQATFNPHTMGIADAFAFKRNQQAAKTQLDAMDLAQRTKTENEHNKIQRQNSDIQWKAEESQDQYHKQLLANEKAKMDAEEAYHQEQLNRPFDVTHTEDVVDSSGKPIFDVMGQVAQRKVTTTLHPVRDATGKMVNYEKYSEPQLPPPPKPGDIVEHNGVKMRFKGGNVYDQNNWEKA